jgi:hypothetical protein
MRLNATQSHKVEEQLSGKQLLYPALRDLETFLPTLSKLAKRRSNATFVRAGHGTISSVQTRNPTRSFGPKV